MLYGGVIVTQLLDVTIVGWFCHTTVGFVNFNFSVCSCEQQMLIPNVAIAFYAKFQVTIDSSHRGRMRDSPD